MNKGDIMRLLSAWPAGQQLNLYLDNGFNATVLKDSDVKRVESDYIIAVDCFDRTFLVPTDHVSLFKFSEEPASARKHK